MLISIVGICRIHSIGLDIFASSQLRLIFRRSKKNELHQRNKHEMDQKRNTKLRNRLQREDQKAHLARSKKDIINFLAQRQ